MIDTTKVQFEPIPPDIYLLQSENSKLNTDNKFLTNTLIIVSAVVVGYLIYKNYKKIKDNRDLENQGVNQSYKV